MGSKLWFVGATIILAVYPFINHRNTLICGAIIMIIGTVLILLDK